MSNLLALDQASVTTGYAIFKDGVLDTYNKFTLEDEDLGKRLVSIRRIIIGLVNKYNIDEIAFEDIQLQNNVGNNVQTFKTLSEVFGVIHETVIELGIKYTIVPSLTWKSTLGIKGRNRQEQKRDAQRYVIENYGIKPSQDICDAICIGNHILKKCEMKEKMVDGGFDWSD